MTKDLVGIGGITNPIPAESARTLWMPEMIRSFRFLLVCGLLLFWASSVVGAALVHYPENQGKAASPDRVYALYNRNSDREPTHSLYIQSQTSGIDQKVLDYGRHIDVMWSPGSDAFFVNDYSGSSEANCLVFFTDGLRRLDVNSLLKGISEKDFLGSDHLYATCKKWNKDGLILAVWGHGDSYPNGFNREYFANPFKPEIHRIG